MENEIKYANLESLRAFKENADKLYATKVNIDQINRDKADKTLVVTATPVEGESGTWDTDISSDEVIAHINNGGNTTLSLVNGVKNVLLYGVNDDGTVMYGLTLASADGVVNDVFVLLGNTLIEMQSLYAPDIIPQPQPDETTVGQVLRIKELDSNGKITATETVDVYTESEIDEKFEVVDKAFSDIDKSIKEKASIENYKESIIALSVNGTTVTYIKGDGSEHSFETQDTNTTYSLGTDEETGLTKLYATVGNAEDGTMTQLAIKTELDKKVGVSVDTATSTLIFTK